MTCNASALSASAEVQYIPLPTDRDREFYTTQWESIEAYDKLLDSFSGEADACALSDAEADTDRYPDYFGGAYINDDGGLVILTTDMSGPAVSGIRSAAGGDVTVLPCEVSLNEMLETIDVISNQRGLLEEQGVEITMIRDDILSGSVIVGVKDLTGEKAKTVQAAAGCGYLKFQNTDGGSELQTTIKAGARIDNSNTKGYGTVGFAAITSYGAKGIVTAGHVAPKRDDKIYYGEESIGVARIVSFHNDMTADASFILTDSDVTPISQVVNGYRIASAKTNKVPVDTPVFMYGTTSGLTSGKIISYKQVGVYTNGNGYWYFDFASASYPSQDGDSGGPVLVYNGASNYSLIGIHSGSTDEASVFTPYENIVEALNVTCVPYYS